MSVGSVLLFTGLSTEKKNEDPIYYIEFLANLQLQISNI